MATTEEPILDLAWSTQVAMCMCDLYGHILQANPAFLALIEASEANALAGLSLYELLDLPSPTERNEQEMPKMRWTATMEGTLRRRDGHRLPVLIEFSSLEHVADRYIARMVDLAEHRRVQRYALHAAAIIDSSEDAILSEDLDGRIVSWNTGAERLYGYRAPEVIGQHKILLIPPECEDEFAALQSRLQRGETITQHETVRMCKDGTRVLVSVTISPIRESNGTIVGASSIARNLTDRQQMEILVRRNEELLQRYRHIQEVNRLKSEFLANMSHEFRTPLNAIIGFSELLYDEETGSLSAEQKEYLGDILSSSKHLLRLITDVLDLAKIEAGKMTFLPELVELNDLVKEVCSVMNPLLDAKRLHLAMQMDPLPGEITVDPAKLKQVLYNYLSNAVKFTPQEGQITIRVRAEGADAFRLEVEDTGRGIEREHLGRLFVAFEQLDPALTKSYQGTGLGLALTKRIVEAQGGRIGVESIPQRGSIFFAVLPRICTVMTEHESEQDLSEQEPALFSRADAPWALIVEDEPKDRQQLIQAFTQVRYNVEVAMTGAQALNRCRQRPFDIITLDLLLPDLSGWEVLRAIRGKELNREVPVIVITLIAEKEVGLGFPIQEIIKKPISPERLFDVLNRIKHIPILASEQLHHSTHEPD